MIMKKETLVFVASLAIIFIIGYVNMSMAPKDVFNPDENEIVQDESVADNEIFGDITDITDLTDLANNENIEDSEVPVIQTNEINISFANFKLTKEKSNLDIVDQLEENLSNSLISESTKEKFENFLLNKNNYIEKEKDIELMLQSKGYNESIAVVDADFIKVITNDTIEQADAIKILDVIVSETNYEPSQIKIVKFDNIDL
ncbi:stage III sporulation protein AH [Sedimentibacter acidaminivorans]|jgi:stage III sporulation protein AH|uniref:Stage III sporulation protein AH n=1 Tax=Sedimentibacter acidaminivorans TaxID=913099 RepID=A0ABS4GDG6_9FIRM|nr:SpoIIIAH-like family protein [Sedimentibacter acidaminivorans]MBP1925425.1 stage III sporulation protein AH [Sedimentibacter acidaminivorans]